MKQRQLNPDDIAGYRLEQLPRRHVLCFDCKSFFASVESTMRGIHPLKSKLCVVSNAEQRSGLVLASSAQMKRQYNIKTGTRTYELPKGALDMLIVPPRMSLYMEKNRDLNRILLRYVALEDWHPYSIDEGFVDVTRSYHLYDKTPRELAERIQREVWQEMGLVIAIGIGDNPLLAKYSLDLEAKNLEPDYIAEWHYEDVPEKLWPHTSLSDTWGIGRKMSERLNRLRIHSLYDLAHADVSQLKKEFGVIGEQMYYHSHGIDFSVISEKFVPQQKGFGKSQILPRDYIKREEIEIVIQEMVDQVASRLRDHEVHAAIIHLSLGFGKGESYERFSHQTRIQPTSASFQLVPAMIALFRKNYRGQKVRQISISLGDVRPANDYQFSLFEDPTELNQQITLESSIDKIRKKLGYSSLVRASSLQPGGTAINRSHLVGGHDGGQSKLHS